MHNISAIELFSRNLKIFMTMKRLDFFKIVQLTKGQISYSYLQNFRRPKNFNPSIDKLELIANAIKIPLRTMFDKNVSIEGDYSMPEGFVRREALLSDAQNILIAQWEKENERRVADIRKQEKERLRQLAQH